MIITKGEFSTQCSSSQIKMSRLIALLKNLRMAKKPSISHRDLEDALITPGISRYHLEILSGKYFLVGNLRNLVISTRSEGSSISKADTLDESHTVWGGHVCWRASSSETNFGSFLKRLANLKQKLLFRKSSYEFLSLIPHTHNYSSVQIAIRLKVFI